VNVFGTRSFSQLLLPDLIYAHFRRASFTIFCSYQRYSTFDNNLPSFFLLFFHERNCFLFSVSVLSSPLLFWLHAPLIFASSSSSSSSTSRSSFLLSYPIWNNRLCSLVCAPVHFATNTDFSYQILSLNWFEKDFIFPYSIFHKRIIITISHYSQLILD